MDYPRLYHHDRGTTCLHCRLPIQQLGLLALDPLKTPVPLGEFSPFSIPSLGFHHHTKLLLCSCHGLCGGVLNVNVHCDIIGDGLDCCVRSLWELSGSEWHCRDWKDVGIQPHTFSLYSLWSSHMAIFGLHPFPWHQRPPVRIPQDLRTRSLRGEYCYVP